ncbi:MAG TPA: hypothetical protein VMQ67_13215, partial [Candidatus Saccharimonadales bacterium]|nr:hypothetical protein [Candidatus Saccharimonadales bacterium]
MNRKRFFPVLLLGLAAAILDGPRSCAAADRLVAEFLRCEYQVDPLGIDETSPRLSWRVSSLLRGE